MKCQNILVCTSPLVLLIDSHPQLLCNPAKTFSFLLGTHLSSSCCLALWASACLEAGLKKSPLMFHGRQAAARRVGFRWMILSLRRFAEFSEITLRAVLSLLSKLILVSDVSTKRWQMLRDGCNQLWSGEVGESVFCFVFFLLHCVLSCQ